MIDTNTRVFRALAWVFGASGVLSIAHAFVPLDEFVHRTDDAFYYFTVAFNYPETGVWSFDGIHPTNGVQPLWAWTITALAQVMAWLGLRDADVFARAVVFVAAACHVTTALLLFRLVSRLVSVAAGAAVAAALLLPLGMVWRHVWGMENSLYALLLTLTSSFYLFSFRRHESNGSAVRLGLWLGLTALSRLNAALLAVGAVGAILVERRSLSLTQRLRFGTIVAAVSGSCVVPYLVWNVVTTGHPLPISGAVKTLQTAEFLRRHDLDSRWSWAFLASIAESYGRSLRTFVTSRMEDALTLVGGRLALGEEGDWTFLVLLAVVVATPLAFGWRGWISTLTDAARRLSPLWFVAAFAALNAAISVLSYPAQIPNAMTKWWLVESEVLIVVVVGTVVGLATAAAGSRLLPGRLHARAAVVAVAVLVAAHATRSVRTFWDGEFQLAEWNLSWNDESLRAAQWLKAHAPPEAIVGSWNAGVLGFYASQPVTNLDGLINNFDLVPFLRNGTLGAYVLHSRITYLADMASMFDAHGMHGQLVLHEVYRRRNQLMRHDYVIYQVLGPAPPQSRVTRLGH